jgi:hypothetical protein
MRIVTFYKSTFLSEKDTKNISSCPNVIEYDSFFLFRLAHTSISFLCYAGSTLHLIRWDDWERLLAAPPNKKKENRKLQWNCPVTHINKRLEPVLYACWDYGCHLLNFRFGSILPTSLVHDIQTPILYIFLEFLFDKSQYQYCINYWQHIRSSTRN